MISEAQRQERHKAIGSSDIAALFNIGPKTWVDLYYEKTQPENFADMPTNTAMEAGNAFEAGILDHFEQKWGLELIRDVRRACPEIWLVSNMDSIVAMDGIAVEAKFRPWNFDQYGDEGSDHCPKADILQCHAHMIATDRTVCYLHAWLRDRGFVTFTIERVDELVDRIAERCVRFWKYVTDGTPPPDATACLDTLKRIARTPGAEAPVSATELEMWKDASHQRKKWEQKEKSHYRNLVDSLGDAEVGTVDGKPVLTYYQQHKKAHAVKAVDYRVLRPKGGGDE